MWEKTIGPIPKDEHGRTYDIHHIDGNRNNDDISNLRVVSIQEHYDIHYKQKDYGCCWAISLRMGQHPSEREFLKPFINRKGIKRPDMIGDLNPMRRPEVAKKIGDCHKNKIVSDEQKQKQSIAMKAKENISCPHCGKEVSGQANYNRWHGDLCLLNPNRPDIKRTATFSNNPPGLIVKECEHCKKMISMPNYYRWHGNKCKQKDTL